MAKQWLSWFSSNQNNSIQFIINEIDGYAINLQHYRSIYWISSHHSNSIFLKVVISYKNNNSGYIEPKTEINQICN